MLAEVEADSCRAESSERYIVGAVNIFDLELAQANSSKLGKGPRTETHLYNVDRGLMGLDAGLSMAPDEGITGDFPATGDLPATAAGLFIVCGVAKHSFPSPKEDVVKTNFKS